MSKHIIFSMLFLFVSGMVSAQDKNFIDQNYIEVTGTAKIELVPDEIYVKVVISEKDDKTKQSLEDLERKMIKKLEDIGIDIKEDLSVIDFTSNLGKVFLGKEVFTSKEYQVRASTGKTVAEIYMELEKMGISDISISQLDHSEIEKYRREVKIDAVKAAKEKAAQMAEAIDQTVGKAIYIQEMDNYYRPLQREANYAMAMDYKQSEQKIPELDFQKIVLEYQVLTRFALE